MVGGNASRLRDAVLRTRCAFIALAGSLAGTAVQLRQPLLWNEASCIGGAVAGCVLLFAVMRAARREGRAPGGAGRALVGAGGPRATGAAWVAAALAGMLIGGGLAGWRAAAYAAGALDPALEGRDLALVGTVSEMPQRGDLGSRFRFDVSSAQWTDAGGAQVPVPAMPDRIALGWYAEDAGSWREPSDAAPGAGAAPSALLPASPVHTGERWRLTVRLRAPHGHRNPHGFDSELWMWEQGLRASGSVRTGARDAPPVRLDGTWRHPVERAREWVRDAVFARVPDRFAAGVIAALVTGDQSAIDRAGWEVFRATGIAHLMSISGLHVTMFAWLAAHAVGLCWRRSARLMLSIPAQRAALAGGVLLAALYALFSGWGVPSQRTVWMLATVALLRLTGSRWPWPHRWLLTAGVVVAIDPWAMTQAGFWLSFVAVGVLFATDEGRGADGPAGRGARLWRLLREQWVITLALTPLGLLLFQQVSLVGLAANLVAIPWVTLVITPLAMLGTAAAPLWDLAALSIRIFATVLQWLAALPFAAVSMAAPPWWLAGCGVAGGVLATMRLPWSVRALGMPLLLPVLLWQPARPAEGEFELLAADIGQGNAVLVRTARHSLLYDSGPRYSLESDAGHRVLVPLLRAAGEQLDMLVLSHRDADHTGGAPAVLAQHPRARLLASIESAHPLQSLRPAQRCEAGQRWTWDGVAFEVLHPQAGDYAFSSKPNAVSCVLRIGNGRATALLAGDIERLQEAALIERVPDRLRADVLLVPHHGSRTSSSAAFLDAVRPRIGLVQAGYRNRFGHPVAEVTARHAERGIGLVESARCGAAHWRSDRPAELGCERSRAPRYWQHRPPRIRPAPSPHIGLRRTQRRAGTASKKSRTGRPSPRHKGFYWPRTC